MYNSITASEIKGVSPLDDLDIERLPQKLTEAYARIISKRISILETQDQQQLTKLLDELKRLGNTYLALINFVPSSELRKSTAFVAGSAFEILSTLDATPHTGFFSGNTICQTCAAALLFMIADAPSDAAEISKYLKTDAEDTSIQGQLSRAIKCLATGDLSKIAGLENKIDFNKEVTEVAVDILYARCLDGIKELCKALLGDKGIESAISIFQKTKSSCTDENEFLKDFFPTEVFSSFPGPFLLASLLEYASLRLFHHSLVNIPSPDIAKKEKFRSELKRFAKHWPYLWQNHKRIIEENHFLDTGVSAVLSLPTGAGKTMLAKLKALAKQTEKQKIIFLAPTHALVRQITQDWAETFPTTQVRNSFLFEGEYAETEELVLPDITVMTPERCLSLLSISPQSFSSVGLVILDECHILHATSLENSYRAIDAMFCLLGLFEIATKAEFVLMSAMIENTDDLSSWIEQQTGHRCISVLNEWKPTRQVRGCVIYKDSDTEGLKQKLHEDRILASKTNRRSVSAKVKRNLFIHPLGIFCLNQTWSTSQLADYIVLPLSSNSVPLEANQFWSLRANRNAVSAHLAAQLSDTKIKTIIFCQQVDHAYSIAKKVAGLVENTKKIILNTREQYLLECLITEVGDAEHVYTEINGVSACHHGLLLAQERELAEGLFSRDDGIGVLVATPTLAQGMNLPAEAVIIAGDERFDSVQNEQEQLEAHELLNAVGRAGRAGQNAQGLVLVVPRRVVELDSSKNSLSPEWFTLKDRVFSKSDQCLAIIDPIQRLIDEVHYGIFDKNLPSVKYMFRRIPYFPEKTVEANLRDSMNRSFAAFMAKKKNNMASFQKTIKVAEELKSEMIQDYLEKNNWVISLSAELGMDPAILLRIDKEIDFVKPHWGIKDYLKWIKENNFLEDMLKPPVLEQVFTNLTAPNERIDQEKIKKIALERLIEMLAGWVQGRTFQELENMTGPSPTNKCIKARKLAMRWAVDTAYALGIVTRLFRRRCEKESGRKMPVTLATLAACIRQGVDSPEKLAVLNLKHFDITRIQAHHLFEKISHLTTNDDLYASFFDIQKRVGTALKQKGYL